MTADASKAGSKILSTLRTRSVGRIKSLLGGQIGPGTPMFESAVLRSPDYEYFCFDFTETSITASTGPFLSSNPFALVYAESNAGATDPAKLTPTAASSSDLSLATSANAYSQSIITTKMFTADKYPWVEVRFQVSTVASGTALVIGFADAIAASAGAIVSDIDTPAVATVADGAFYAIDTAQTLTTAALVAVGTSTAVSKTNVAPTSAPYGVPTASTYLTVRVELEGNGVQGSPAIARLFVNDALVAINTGGPDSEKLLSVVFWQLGPAAGLTTLIDYIRGGQQKAGSPL